MNTTKEKGKKNIRDHTLIAIAVNKIPVSARIIILRLVFILN